MDEQNKGEIIMYRTEDGLTEIQTTLVDDTVWLSIDQMAELFQRDRSVIGKHVRNIFREGELQKESVWAKFAYTATDGKVYDVDYYNHQGAGRRSKKESKIKTARRGFTAVRAEDNRFYCQDMDR